jgi:hypothetical protein
MIAFMAVFTDGCGRVRFQGANKLASFVPPTPMAARPDPMVLVIIYGSALIMCASLTQVMTGLPG